MTKEQLRFTGAGGQGIIMATIILAEAAFLDGRQVVQSQSYGPEARGGMCKAEVIIDDRAIYYTKVDKPTLLLALTQDALNKYIRNIPRDTIIVTDDSISIPDRINERQRVIKLPILHSACEVINNKMSANIISCGIINELLGLASEKSLRQAVMNHIPKGTEVLNERAMQLGMRLARGVINSDSKGIEVPDNETDDSENSDKKNDYISKNQESLPSTESDASPAETVIPVDDTADTIDIEK